MRRAPILLALPALPCLALPCLATLAVPAQATVPARTAQLVTLMLDQQVIGNVVEQATERQFADMAARDKDYAALVSAHPGIDKALVARMRTELGAIMPAALPELRTLLAGRIAARMNAAQIDATIAMLRTPTGQALYREVVRQALGGRDAAKDARAVRSIRPDDLPQLMLFQTSGAAERFRPLGTELGALSRTWGEALVERNEGRLRAAGMETANAFIARDKASGSGAGASK